MSAHGRPGWVMSMGLTKGKHERLRQDTAGSLAHTRAPTLLFTKIKVPSTKSKSVKTEATVESDARPCVDYVDLTCDKRQRKERSHKLKRIAINERGDNGHGEHRVS